MVDQVSAAPVGRPTRIGSSGSEPSRAAPQRGQKSATDAATSPRLAGSELARTLVEQGPPVDGDKVARLRVAIADGSYRIDADRTARAMIAFERPET